MRIFWRLLISFILIGFLPLLLMTFLSYKKSEDLILEEQFLSLSEILKSRTKTLTEYFENLKNSAEIISQTENTQHFFNYDVEGKLDLEKEAHSFFKRYAGTYSLEDMFVISQDGDVLYTLKEGHIKNSKKNVFNVKSELVDLFEKIKSNEQSYIAPLSNKTTDGTYGIFIGVPIFFKGAFTGVFAIRVSVAKIYEIFHDYTSLKSTGEVLIAILDNDRVLFVNPIRHKPDSAFNFSVQLGSNIALPMQSAVQKVPGSGLSIDYRNEKIIAVWDYYPLLETGIVVKIDQNEAFKPLEALGIILISTGLGAALLMIILAILLSKWLSKPIITLQEIAHEIGKGNLDTKITINSNDEFGNLGRSLQQMTEDLKKSMTSVHILNKEIQERKRLEGMRKEMLSRVSHELRTPLGPIKEGVDLVLENKSEDLSPKQRELLLLVQKNTIRLETLIESVLQFQKLSEREESFNYAKENINSLIKEEIEYFHQNIESKHLQLKLELQDQLPFVFCDKKQIKKVVNIILDNAIKFTDHGTIWIKSEQIDKEIKVTIKDEGIGISKEDLEKLFQSFRELDIKSYEKKQGVGLNLDMAKHIITIHEGTIGADSILQKGSTFYFTLPIYQDKENG